MTLILIVVHIVVCIALIMIVLLQTGKGADMGAAFGGGSSNTLFGSSGASTFLGKATTFAAVMFMLTSLGLAYMSSHRTSSSIMMDAAPIEQSAPASSGELPATDAAPATETANEAQE
jgi:preprotein translocase subunit SecG